MEIGIVTQFYDHISDKNSLVSWTPDTYMEELKWNSQTKDKKKIPSQQLSTVVVVLCFWGGFATLRPRELVRIQGIMGKEEHVCFFKDHIKNSTWKVTLGHHCTYQHHNDLNHTVQSVMEYLDDGKIKILMYLHKVLTKIPWKFYEPIWKVERKK